MTTAEELLIEVCTRLNELDALGTKPDNSQNIIELLGKGHDEVAFCKILWHILNLSVKGKKEYLAGFIRNVLGITDIDDTEIDKAFVYREYCIPDSKRRIDLVIKTPSHFLPIEAKIYSLEHGNQCADYLAYAETFYSNPEDARVWFLTLDGRREEAAGADTSTNRIKSIFWETVYEWLKIISEITPEHRDIIIPFCKAIDVILNRENERMAASFIDQLINKPDRMKAAIEIENALKRMREDLLRKIIDGVKKWAAAEGLKCDPELNSPEITDEQISRFYSYQKSSCPGLNFNVGEIHTGSAGSRYFFVLRFEIDFRPFAGFGIWKLERDGKLTMIQSPSFELVKNVRSRVKRPEMLKNENKFWLYWEYVCSRGTEVSQIDPNFKEFNEAYLSLFNDVERQRFIDQAIYSLTELKKWLI